MGSPRGHRSVRVLLSIISIAMATVSAGIMSAPTAAAEPEIVLTKGSPIGEYLEGGQLTNQLVAQFTDAGNPPVEITRPTTALLTCDQVADARYTATIDWLGNGAKVEDGTVSCSSTPGVFDVRGDYIYKDSGTYNVKVTVTDTADKPNVSASGTTDTADVADRSLRSTGGSVTSATEGGTVRATATFWDNNPAYDSNSSVDPGLTATIDWGDGTISAADKIEWPDSSDVNVAVSGSHAYDSNKPPTQSYTIKVTLHDDGALPISKTLHATIADAALTAGGQKTISGTAGQSATAVVASFTDAAGGQAKAADFTATINWGDNSSSSGTVTQTAAGAFDVSGTHTYASAGNRTLTISVKDEELQTLSLSATASVGAAPVVLPLTGGARPASPGGSPLLPLLGLTLALMAGCGFVARVVLRRSRA